MKKAILVSGVLLFALTVLLPLGVFLSSCFGYTFELASYPIFAIITVLLSIGVVILCIAAKETVDNRLTRILFALLLPISLINAAFYMTRCIAAWVWVCVIMLVCTVCCCYLTIKRVKPLIMKTISLVLSAIMVLPVLYYGIIALIISLLFGNIGVNTVVQSVESPKGTYYAEVINSDQGALGGDVFIDVHENKVINALIFKITKKAQRVYHGDWGEVENMDIYWKDNNCLIINSVEYTIK